MRPKRYPYSGKLKASTTGIVKAWEKAYSAYRVKGQKRQEKAEQELDKATQRLYQPKLERRRG
ncbi:hypothetical protein [Streptococcus suis]|uniref:hypothetical protein n=1 Tax=Streptococcus suis TaxID=1307 RepID=UPI0004257B49|nr:hypothetical protein [Streptococcus suis]